MPSLSGAESCELGRILQDRRVVLGLSQSHVAASLSLSPAYVGLIEQAKPRPSGRPSVPTLEKLREWLDLLKMPDHERERVDEILYGRQQLSRRTLLKIGVAAAVLPVVAVPEAGRIVAHRSLAPTLRTLPKETGMGGLREWLWDHATEVTWKAGSEHRLQQQFLKSGYPAHPADMEAIAGILPNELATVPIASTADQIRVSLRRSIVTAGSPASDGLSRVIFGYSGQPDHLSHSNNYPLTTPYHWLLNADEVQDAKYYIGGELIDRPNWNVADRDNRPLSPPITNEYGILVSDWLLVTRVRNFLDDAAFSDGAFILSVAGAHGLGTKAAGMLVRDAALCREIDARLGRGAEEFQLLLKVEADGTEPTAIELIGAHRLNYTQSQYQAAGATARTALTELFGA